MRQIWSVGAGLGKSRCVAAFIVAMYELFKKREFVVVFSNEVLKENDKRFLEKLELAFDGL